MFDTCTYLGVIAFASTNVPLTSASTWTPFHQPPVIGLCFIDFCLVSFDFLHVDFSLVITFKCKEQVNANFNVKDLKLKLKLNLHSNSLLLGRVNLHV